MTEIVYFNGEFIPLSEAKVPVSDSGFLYGYGCYETLRGYHGRTFRLNDHLKRLSEAAQFLDIAVDTLALAKIVPEILKRNLYADSRVRVTLTGGDLNPNTLGRTPKNPNLLVTALEYHPYTPEMYETGFQVIIARAARNTHSRLPELKTTCFLESLLARRQAISAGAADAVLLNENGLLAEASSSNIFIFKDGILKTPRLGSGLLPGVTRQIVLDLARQNSLNALECDITAEEFINSEEVFLTNSMVEIMPVTAIEGKVVGAGKPGPLTRKLRDAYTDLVNRETI
jgi:branched-chain amino acid aminotransferase